LNQHCRHKVPHVFKQGQIQPNTGRKITFTIIPEENIKDSHASPISPGRYIELRLIPMLKFCQRRLPRYPSINCMCQLLLIVSNLVAAMFTHIGLEYFVVCLTSFGGTISAWLGYHVLIMQRNDTMILLIKITGSKEAKNSSLRMAHSNK